MRDRQQHRNVLDYLTEAKNAASWGRQVPSLLLRRCGTVAPQAVVIWVESLSRYTLNGYLPYTPAWQR